MPNPRTLTADAALDAWKMSCRAIAPVSVAAVSIAAASIDHYENFPVASLLCPARLRPAVRAIYAYARTADDLADEGTHTDSERLARLAAYEADLHAVAAGTAPSGSWPEVYGPLAVALREFGLPVALLADLLSAFRQDVVQHCYADRAELLDYCRRSADPVGRLVLHLHRIDDAASLRCSDDICTALQLANFWQDLSVDTARGRLYAPHADCERHGVAPDALLQGRPDSGLDALMRELVAWARATMLRGAPLVHRLDGRAGWELRFVVQGGLAILDRCDRLGARLLRERPTIGSGDLPRLAWRAFAMGRRPEEGSA
jgi:squalene synthase HpnC